MASEASNNTFYCMKCEKHQPHVRHDASGGTIITCSACKGQRFISTDNTSLHFDDHSLYVKVDLYYPVEKGGTSAFVKRNDMMVDVNYFINDPVPIEDVWVRNLGHASKEHAETVYSNLSRYGCQLCNYEKPARYLVGSLSGLCEGHYTFLKAKIKELFSKITIQG